MEIQFLKWLKKNKSSSISRPEKYSKTINTISNHFKKVLNEDINIYNLKDYNNAIEIKERYFSHKEFYDKNKKGNRMYSRSLDLYIEFLAQMSNLTSYSEKEEQKREKESIILSRIGQGEFRENVIKHWRACAITGFSDERFLIASHIKPWKDSNSNEKIDKYNGILLLPTYDKLFDLGFISFSDTGKILISPNLTNLNMLGLHEDLKIKIAPEHIKYLQYHRLHIFKAE